MNNKLSKIQQRHAILSSIAEAKGFQWKSSGKLINKITGELVSENAHDISKKLLGQSATYKNLETAETIIDFIIKLPEYESLIAEARNTLKLPDATTIEEYKVGTGAWFRKMIGNLF